MEKSYVVRELVVVGNEWNDDLEYKFPKLLKSNAKKYKVKRDAAIKELLSSKEELVVDALDALYIKMYINNLFSYEYRFLDNLSAERKESILSKQILVKSGDYTLSLLGVE